MDSSRLSDFGYILEKFSGKVVPVTEKVLASISENVTYIGGYAFVCWIVGFLPIT